MFSFSKGPSTPTATRNAVRSGALTLALSAISERFRTGPKLTVRPVSSMRPLTPAEVDLVCSGQSQPNLAYPLGFEQRAFPNACQEALDILKSVRPPANIF